MRTYSAGVFAGYLKKRKRTEATLVNCRRIYTWSGAASLSQLAMEGIKYPLESKVAMPVDRILLTECVEIINTTAAARINIARVPEWKI